MRKIHYAWAICAGCTLLHFCTVGLISTVYSVYMPGFLAERAFTNTEASLTITIRCLFSLPAMLLAGQYYKRFSIRQGVSIALLLVVAASVLYGLSTSHMASYIASAMMGIAYGVGTMIPISIVIGRWFESRHGLALGISACGSGLASVITPPLITLLMEQYGLRTAFLVQGAFVLLAAGIVFAIVRDYPEEMGLSPYRTPGAETTEKPPEAAEVRGPAMPAAMLGMVLLGVVAIASTGHFSVYFQSIGGSGMFVSACVSAFGLVLTFGKFLFGGVVDRLGSYRINYLFFGALIVGHLVACLASARMQWMMMFSCVLMGLGFPIATVGIFIWAEELSPPGAYPAVLRRFQAAYALGGMLGSALPGMIADQTGSYRPAYALFLVLCVVIMVIVQRALYQKKKAAGEKKTIARVS